MAFSDFVKDFDGETFADNLTHKLMAAGVGCVSAKAKKQSCDAGALGAAVGEVVAEMVTSDDKRFLLELGLLDPNEMNKINNIAQLSAGAIALIVNTDVNVAVNSAYTAVKNNHNLESANKAQISEEGALLIKNVIGGILPIDTVGKVTIALQKGASYSEISQIIGAEGILFLTKAKKLGELGNLIRKLNRSCFIAGTLIETDNGLKPIEEIQQGDMVWSRHEETLEYGYRPVTETARFDDTEIYEVVVQNKHGNLETYQTTEEHPFWIADFGWLPANLLQTGMQVVDRNNNPLTVVSQNKLNKTDTVYNFTVDEFHTYHIGEFGVWVHNTCFKTPSGRVITNHAFRDSLERHGFKNLKQIDDIIDNPKKRTSEQLDGAIVHIVRNGKGAKAKFDYVVEGEEGIVTGLRNMSKQDVKKLAHNNGWTFPF